MIDDKNNIISDSNETVCDGSESEQHAQQDELTNAIGQQYKRERDGCLAELSRMKDLCQHVAADFENFKKRVERDKVMWGKVAQADVLLNLLPIIDDFDRALESHRKQEHTAQIDPWLEGFELIGASLYKFLQTCGVTVIQKVIDFDPELHEAIAHVESSVHNGGQIVDIVQKGFIFNERVLRPARVTVAK